jgi:hypothetical protein
MVEARFLPPLPAPPPPASSLPCNRLSTRSTFNAQRASRESGLIIIQRASIFPNRTRILNLINNFARFIASIAASDVLVPSAVMHLPSSASLLPFAKELAQETRNAIHEGALSVLRISRCLQRKYTRQTLAGRPRRARCFLPSSTRGVSRAPRVAALN